MGLRTANQSALFQPSFATLKFVDDIGSSVPAKVAFTLRHIARRKMFVF